MKKGEHYFLYKVGGYIRDRLLGIESKDIDYAFVFSDDVLEADANPEFYYELMKTILVSDGIKIYTEKPECFTVRGKYGNLDVDFVMARKETYDDPNSRIPTVKMGTLYDDLRRRDFTLNAIAEDEEGNIIDPFNGQSALKMGLLRCPVDAKTSFNDDPLRMLRALRFCVTKNFRMSGDILKVIRHDKDMWDKFAVVVSQERIREEVNKMFKHDTIRSIMILNDLENSSGLNIFKRIFGEEIWLKPTNEKR
jgi:poly(A) polymerase